jgi:hypothetical protein
MFNVKVDSPFAAPRRKTSAEPTFEQRRQKTSGLMGTAANLRAKAARQKYEEGRAAVESGIAGSLGRSARMARGGGVSSMMSGVGKELARDAASAKAQAELDKTEGLLEREQFLAESQVSDAEAMEAVKAFADSIQATYETFWYDDEGGFAEAIEGWARGKSPAIVAAAKNHADDIRGGRIKMGWV